jgi:hypothetical protein
VEGGLETEAQFMVQIAFEHLIKLLREKSRNGEIFLYIFGVVN